MKKFTDKNQRTKLSDEDSVRYKTYGGKFVSTETARLPIRLVEFGDETSTHEFQVDAQETGGKYDMIIGSDIMEEMAIDIVYSDHCIERNGVRVPLKLQGELSDEKYCERLYNMHTDSPILQQMEERQGRILDANYTKVDIDVMVDELDITRSSKRALKSTLKKFPTLFGGGLGLLDMEPVSIKLKEGSKPYQGRYYNIPKAYERPTRTEIDRMVTIDVLRKLSYDNDSPWAAPTFTQPKKTGDIRILTDFRKLNECIERKPFPLPRIGEAIQKLENFKSATALDLSQGFYSIPIDEDSQKLATTVLPWGKYAYKRLPMGIACAPDIFQSIMMEMLGDLEHVLVYIDDILIVQKVGESEEDHLRKIEEVLSRLDAKGFRANLRKSFFMQKEVEYLGYLLTTGGLKPQSSKIEAMHRIMRPKNSKQLKMFLGMVNFYRDMFPKRSHFLAPLNKLSTMKGKDWYWGANEQKDFEEAKKMLTVHATLAFPDFEQPFDLYTDASDRQLGATLVQNGKPLGFYTRKLNSAQMNYTVGEKELLGIIEGFKAFEGMIRGQELTVHTDHLNLLYQSMPSQRMIRWRLMLEEWHPTIKHVAGVDNDGADALSRLDIDKKDFDTINWEKSFPKLSYSDRKMKEAEQNVCMQMCNMMSQCEFECDEFDDEYLYPMAAEKELADSEFPLDVRTMKQHQDKDASMLKLMEKTDTDRYTVKEVEGVFLCHDNNRILVPTSMKDKVLQWYHLMQVHPGEKRMERTIRFVYTWKGLKADVKRVCKHCHVCQISKNSGRKKFGLVPEKEGEVTKWSRVNVDMWGPKTIRNKNGKTYKIHVMTMVDPVTGWFELAQLRDKPNAFMAMKRFDSQWLARYPRPREIGFDNGGEFMAEFRDLCDNMGLKRRPSSSWNPQSNAILERIHQVLADCLRSFNLDERTINEMDDDPFEEFLSAAAFSIRCSYHQTHGHSPAQMVFGRDMFMPVDAAIDWEQIQQRKQLKIQQSNIRENSKRILHKYKEGDLITLRKPGAILRTLALPRRGPYKVVKHHENGSITTELEPNVLGRVNIRRCHPYYKLPEEQNDQDTNIQPTDTEVV